MSLAIFASTVEIAKPQAPVPTATAVCFTPAEHCENLIVKAIDGALETIRVQAWGFTSLPIIHALPREHKTFESYRDKLTRQRDTTHWK